MSTKVLVVDDSPMVRQLVARTLGEAGFSMVEAVDGRDALEKLAVAPDTGLIVCDINMPIMNGLEFLEVMRKDEKYVAIPVVILTTEGESQLIRRAKALGAKGWIVKPFNPQLLIAAAKKLTATA